MNEAVSLVIVNYSSIRECWEMWESWQNYIQYFHIESMRVWVSKLGNESIKIYKINQVWQKERMRIYDYKSMRYESLRLLECCTYEVWENESIRLLQYCTYEVCKNEEDESIRL